MYIVYVLLMISSILNIHIRFPNYSNNKGVSYGK